FPDLSARLSVIDKTHLHAIEAGTFGYALLHFIEGIGLIMRRDWAAYLVVIASGSLIPFEIYEIARKPVLLRMGILVVNIVIVIYLIVTLRREHRIRTPGQEIR